MWKSKLWRTLQTLTDRELRHFTLYLKSPYFLPEKKSAELLRLYQLLQHRLTSRTVGELEKEVIFDSLYPGETYDVGRLDKLMSYLLQELTHFIHLEAAELQKDSMEEWLYLSAYFRERKSYDLWETTLNRLDRIYKKKEIVNQKDFYNHFQLTKERLQQQLLQRQPSANGQYDHLFQSLDLYYLLTRLEEACFLLSINNFVFPVKVEPYLTFLEEGETRLSTYWSFGYKSGRSIL